LVLELCRFFSSYWFLGIFPRENISVKLLQRRRAFGSTANAERASLQWKVSLPLYSYDAQCSGILSRT
jgi:hypothetical protein